MDNLFKVEKLIKKYNEGTSIVDLQQELLDNNYDMTLLNELIDSYKVIEIADDKYIHIENTPYVVGKYVEKKYSSFVLVNNDSYNISNSDVCIDNDLVLINVTNKKSKTGEVIKILKREDLYIYGEVVMIKNNYFLDPESSKYKKLTINLDNNDNNLVVGSMVVVKIDGDVISDSYVGDVVSYIGLSSDPNIDILTEAWKLGVDNSFTDKAMEEVNNLPVMVRDIDKIGRCDLTDKQIFTIDGDDTKDIDDAISLEILPNGNYQLGVHITDVTYYIKEGSELDRLALKKGTSYYLADTVIPMYPKLFSNGIGSLNPNVERLALSCVMEINSQGTVVNYNIFESVIKSKIQMTYKKVNDILDNNIVAAGYENFVSTLKDMYKLSLILNKKRILHGALEFGMPQQKIKLDEKGFPLDFEILSQGTGENLIEEFMLVANQTVAQALGEYDYPTMYRVHDVPAPEVVNYFIELINKLGIKYQRREQLDLQHEMQYLSSFVNSYGSKSGPFQYAFLRVLRKAYYSTDNIGHFGLAYKDYVHFTSPIRRYPDDTVHRSIRKYLLNKDKNFDLEEVAKDYEILEEKAHLCSINEKKSDKCELIINAMKAAEYMERHIGEHFIARVLSVDNKGLSIQLQNLIDGRIKINDLDVPYRFDQDSMSLQSLASDECFCYGDLIDVYVVDASKKDKTISFKVSSIIEKNTLARKSFKSKSDKSCYNKVYRKEKK